MIKVVIVDDEVLARVGLKSMIKWDAIGCEIVGDANNGKEGIRMIDELRPDLVITDIRMPVMDGIEMIRHSRKSNSKTRFIVLSSYDEFNLVKEAMRLGAEEYLIKLDITPEMLANTVETICEKICKDAEREREKSIFDRHARMNREAASKEFLKKIIDKAIFIPEDIAEKVKYLDIRLQRENVTCMVIQINEIIDKAKYSTGEDRGLLDFCIENIAGEVANDFFPTHTIKYKEDIFVQLFSTPTNARDDTDKIKKMGERLIGTLNKYLNIHVSVGVCSAGKNIQLLDSAYAEAMAAAEYSFFAGTGKVLFYQEIRRNQVHSGKINTVDLINELRDAVEYYDCNRINEIFNQIGQYLLSSDTSRQQAFDLCFRVAYKIMEIMESEEEFLSVFSRDKELYENVTEIHTLKKMLKWIEELGNKVVDMIKSKIDLNQNGAIIAMAKKYISQHIHENIKLSDAAVFLNLNHCYLSTIFKQTTGEGFADYVARIKITEAQKLLKKREYKVYEVAQMLGYDNAYYFSRVFKKITGMVPSEFI